MKRLLLLPVFFVTFFNSFGQIDFTENVVFNSESYVNGIDSISDADIDNDGDQDIVVASYTSGKICWYENLDGLGNFSSFKLIDQISTQQTKIITADINNDGFIDVVSETNWYRNNGLGDFTISDSYASDNDYMETFDAGDVDGDGDLDIILNKAWYENTNGLGDFVLGQVYFTDANATTSAVGDLDNDGDLDIVTAILSTSRLVWFENTDGLGTYATSELVANMDDPRFVAVADLDNDNDLDIVTVSGGDGNLMVHKNLNQGTNWNSQILYTRESDNYRSLNVTDINGDGDIDISVSFDSAYYRWYENNGNGAFDFQFTQIYGKSFSYNADLDGDNAKDLITVNACYNRLDWYDFLNEEQHYISNSISFVSEVVFADVDNDGDLDIISNGASDCNSSSLGKIVWYENIDGYIDYTGEVIVNAIGSVSFTHGDKIMISDIDNDNDEDVLVLSYDRIYSFLNEDSGASFSLNEIINVNFNSNDFSIADIDSDGDTDLIGYDSGTIWFENIGGNFDNSHMISSNNFESINPVDIDNDGDIDLVYTTFNEIGWYENEDGLGNFSVANQINLIGADFNFTVCSDIDGDSDIDIISFNADDDTIVLFENLSGLFSDAQILVSDIVNTTSFYLSSIILTDIDNDGYNDIVCSSDSSSSFNTDDKVYWFQNLGDGINFGEELGISINRSKGIQAGDFDNDGDFDLVSGRDSNIEIFKNYGNLENEINGIIQLDSDLDGCDSSDLLVSDMLVTTRSGADSFSTFTQDDGSYYMATNAGEFTTTITSQLPTYYQSNPISHSINFDGTIHTDTADFCIEPIATVNDLSISLYPLEENPRPGFDTFYRLIYKNVGTTQLSGEIIFEFDGMRLNLFATTQSVISLTANSATFNYTDLIPFETRTIDLLFNVHSSPTNEIGDILTSSVSVNPVVGDETENNNTFTFYQTIVGSYDPNDITCLEGSEIIYEDASKYLHYIIRFQNTGTASAINVNVENVLDDKLDWSSIQLEDLSHNGRVEITNENRVKFVFENINLPDSTSDEPRSHGFIAYKIKPKNDVIVGDIFYNTADIYFDFNPAIVTNTASTEIVNSLSLDEFSANHFFLFPNPAEDVINIKGNIPLESIRIFDINGRLLNTIKLKKENLNYQMNVSGISQGMYFLEIKSDKSTQVSRFIKK